MGAITAPLSFIAAQAYLRLTYHLTSVRARGLVLEARNNGASEFKIDFGRTVRGEVIKIRKLPTTGLFQVSGAVHCWSDKL